MHHHLLFSAALLALTLLSPVVNATVPEQVHYQGLLTNSAGEPIHCPDVLSCPEGMLDLTFRLYDQDEGGVAVWEEVHEDVALTYGRFHVVLGANTPVAAGLLSGMTYLGVEVEDAGEMSPRQAVVSTPYALRAQVADQLGDLPASDYVTAAAIPDLCVTPEDLPGLLTELGIGEVEGDGDTLASMSCLPGAIAAWNGAFWECDDHLDVYAAHVSDPNAHHPADSAGLDIVPKSVALAGGDTKLAPGTLSLGTDATLSGAQLKTLTQGGDASELHTHGGLDTLSGGLLTNVLDEVLEGPDTPVDIPDNNPAGVFSEIEVGDLGVLETLSVNVHVEASAISQLKIVLFDPNNASYTLHDSSGSGTKLETSWPDPTPLVSGDLSGWLGQTPQGTWRLSVSDWSDDGGGAAGQLVSWSLSMTVTSDNKLVVNGEVEADSLTIKGTLSLESGLPVYELHDICHGEHVGMAVTVDSKPSEPVLTLSPTCKSTSCANKSPSGVYYYACDGTCLTGSPSWPTCSNTLVGHILPP
jgi:subtilisin-like proprotein convertase family protein